MLGRSRSQHEWAGPAVLPSAWAAKDLSACARRSDSLPLRAAFSSTSVLKALSGGHPDMANDDRSLGERVRDARLGRQLGVREFARQLEITPSYLSDIEADRRAPVEALMRTLADSLDLEFDQLMALSGRLGAQAERYIKRTPEAAFLFRRISEKKLSAEELAKLREFIEKS